MAALDPGRRHLAFVPCSELGARSIAIGHRICFALVVGTPRPGPSVRLWMCDLAANWRLPNLGNLAPTIPDKPRKGQSTTITDDAKRPA